MKRDYGLYIEDILEAIGKIEKYTERLTIDDFIRDEKSIDAVIRNFEIIGEAVKHIPANIRGKYSDIPWKAMAGMRDKLTHEYFGIRYDIVWDTIKKRFPEVKPLIEEVLRKMDEEKGKS